MKKNMILLLFFCSYICVTAQEDSKDWQLYQKENGVEIYTKTEDCYRPSRGTQIQYIYIQIRNTTDKSVKISFDKELWYDGKCSTCGKSDPNKVQQNVPAHGSVMGICDSDDNTLKIFSKMLQVNNVRKLSKYELKNITVEKIN